MIVSMPTKACLELSHSGAARRPLATNAKKAFFTWEAIARETKLQVWSKRRRGMTGRRRDGNEAGGEEEEERDKFDRRQERRMITEI